MFMRINSLAAFQIGPFFVFHPISEQTTLSQNHFFSIPPDWTGSEYIQSSHAYWIYYLIAVLKRTTKKMRYKSRKRFVSPLILFLLTIPALNHANPLLNDIEPSILTESMHTMIEYMTKLFCSNQFTYRFNHIYVERSLSTGLADKLINQINGCMTAGVLVSRYLWSKFVNSHSNVVIVCISKGLQFFCFRFSVCLSS